MGYRSHQNIFHQRDIQRINAIQLSDTCSDNWYWRKDKCGNDSVKSAYVMLLESKLWSNQCGNIMFWKRFWNLKVPQKVKHFI